MSNETAPSARIPNKPASKPAEQAPDPNKPQTGLMVPTPGDSQLQQMVTPDAAAAVQIGMGDIAIPRLVIAQPTSNFAGAAEHPGQWFNDVTGEFSPTFRAAIVGIRQQRAVFPEPYTPDEPLLCSSPDGLAPYPEYVGTVVDGVTIPEQCQFCPLAEWGETNPQTKKGTPPRCTLMYLYMGLMADSLMPFSMRLKSTALKAAKRLNFLVQQYHYHAIFEIGTAKGQGSRSYFIPTITLAGESPEFVKTAAAKMIETVIRSKAPSPEEEQAPVGPSEAVVAPPEDEIPF